MRLIAGLTALGGGALAAVALASAGQPGAVDTTFGNHGVASFGSGPAAQISFIAAEAVQADGKVVMVGPTKPDQSGNTEMGVVRLNRDGSLDTTFGAGTGAVLIGFGSGNSATATAVALQSNGDIVVVGAAVIGGTTHEIGVARLTPSGTLDTTFNSTGEATVDTGGTAQGPPDNADTVGVAVQPADQKIVVVGTRSPVNGGSGFQVSRLTTSGQPDTSFGVAGTVTTQIGPTSSKSTAAVVAVQSNGRIVVAGNGTTNTGARGLPGRALPGERHTRRVVQLLRVAAGDRRHSCRRRERRGARDRAPALRWEDRACRRSPRRSANRVRVGPARPYRPRTPQHERNAGRHLCGRGGP